MSTHELSEIQEEEMSIHKFPAHSDTESDEGEFYTPPHYPQNHGLLLVLRQTIKNQSSLFYRQKKLQEKHEKSESLNEVHQKKVGLR